MIETGYRIERMQAGSGLYVLIGTTAPNATSFDDTGLADATTYTYRITAEGPMFPSLAVESAAVATSSPPMLAWGAAPTLSTTCDLSIPASATFSSGLGFASAGGSIPRVTSPNTVSAGATGLSGRINDFTLGPFATQWSVNDTLSVGAMLNRTLSLDYTPVNFLTTPARPQLASFEDASVGRQTWFAPEPTVAGACGSCNGQRGGIAAGGGHGCVLKGDGTVACWGDDFAGQLGDGTLGDPTFNVRTHPTGVRCGAACPGLLGNVSTIGVHDTHSCAVSTGGGVKCWGLNSSGKLGIGSTSIGATVLYPTDVCDSGTAGTCVPLANVIAVAAGDSFTCALLGTGRVKCWGSNTDDIMGSGGDNWNPVDICASGNPPCGAFLEPVVQLAAGVTHVCALLADGTLRCWGSNAFGELGDGTNTSRPDPLPVCASGSGAACPKLQNVIAVAAEGNSAGSGASTCALLSDQTVRCWGWGNGGRLGNDGFSDSPLPVTVCSEGSGPCGSLGNVRAIAVGGSHACALLGDGTARCWGANIYGEAGDGTVGNPRPRPVPVCAPGAVSCASTNQLSGVVALETGQAFTCFLLKTGEVQCTGQNKYAQLGDGSGGTGSATEYEVVPTHTCTLGPNNACPADPYFTGGAVRHCGTLAVSVP
jgi:alpha-tubulin suppressor-like RCC1 family protein